MILAGTILAGTILAGMILVGMSPAETLLISAKAQASDVLQVNIMVNVSSNNTIVETVVFITVRGERENGKRNKTIQRMRRRPAAQEV